MKAGDLFDYRQPLNTTYLLFIHTNNHKFVNKIISLKHLTTLRMAALVFEHATPQYLHYYPV